MSKVKRKIVIQEGDCGGGWVVCGDLRLTFSDASQFSSKFVSLYPSVFAPMKARKRPAMLVIEPAGSCLTGEQIEAMLDLLAERRPFHDLFYSYDLGKPTKLIRRRKYVDERQAELKNRPAGLGLNLMHRGRGEYWMFYKTPMTLDQIEKLIATPSREKFGAND